MAARDFAGAASVSSMEVMLQILDDIEDLVFTIPMLWGSLRAPTLAVVAAALGVLLFA